MAYMLFDNKEEYLKLINDLIGCCDIFTLDKIADTIVKHLYPGRC